MSNTLTRRTVIKVAMGGCLVAAYPIFIERQLIKINHYRLEVESLPRAFNGYQIAHLSDIHLGSMTSDSYIRKIIARTNNLKPDAIVCTGDYVRARNSTAEIDRIWTMLSDLKAKDGVFSVLGNHDHWADTERSLFWSRKTGQDIRHKSKTITRGDSRIIFGGSGDLWEDEAGVDKTFANAQQETCKILLCHNPDTIDSPFTTKISLFLCGHTHGGQVSLPFFGSPILPVKNKRYTSGIISTREGTVFISKGIGWTIVPVRFNCYPEIALLELTPATK